ncbi:MAG: hypothetical protein ACFB10_19080 [Salibacteraceae bacterium]
MNYAQARQALFQRWIKAVPEYAGKLIADGIIEEALFQKQQPKVLFITKEANDPEQNQWDLTDWLRSGLEGQYAHRLSEWAYGIQNDFPPLEPVSLEDRHFALRHTAVITLKKSGGGAQADHAVLKQHLLKNKPLLLEQIHLIKPDIIIGGIGKSFYWDLLFDDWAKRSSGYDLAIGTWKGIKVIDFYHPSYRVPRVMQYTLLASIFRSDAFELLR